MNAQHLEAQEAERSVLGGIFLDNVVIEQVAVLIKAEDFYAPRHQCVYASMLRLAEESLPIDPITMASALAHKGELRELGGIDYLLALAGSTASTVNIEHHAKLIQDAAEVRRLIDACKNIISKAHGGDYEDSTRLFDEAQQAVYEISERRQGKQFTNMAAALKEVVDKVQAAYEAKSAITGIPSGYYDLDDMTAGFQPGDLIILAARPSMGKTALALNLATNGATQSGRSVAFFSLEMPTVQLASRMLGTEAQIGGERMRTGQVSIEEIGRILQTSKVMKPWPIFMDDTAGISSMELRAKCRRLATDKNIPPLGLIIIDYLQLMRGSGNVRSREQEISEISRNLKALAKELNLPVIALSQLNRSLESRSDKRPMMSDLRESGAIEQDADVIMFVYRDEVYNSETEEKNIAEVIIAKQRNGPIGTVRLRFFREWTHFRNLHEREG